MRVLIISDTHRQNNNYLKVLSQVAPVDMVIHCGDAVGSEYLITEAADCPVHFVLGNNDFFSDLPKEIEMTIGKYKVWITHGHNYYVMMDNKHIKREAIARKADIVFYGHTHKPVVEWDKDIIAVNPGSLSYPRQDGHRPSYIMMEIDNKGEAHFTINYL